MKKIFRKSILLSTLTFAVLGGVVPPLSSKVDGPIVPIQLDNYGFDKVAPGKAATTIDYNKPKFKPWVDAGFNWQQFLDTENGAGIGKEVIEKVLDSENDIVRLGFITSFDGPLATNSGNPIVKDFKTFVDANSTATIPAIGGLLPLWNANWTDAWGAKTPDEHQTGSAVYQFLSQIRNAGKDYMFSFGGWNNDSIAMDASLKGYNASQLKDLYGAIIHTLDLKVVDFDIEGTEDGKTDDHGNTHTIAEGQKAKKLRVEALKMLKADDNFKDVRITFTYPTSITGLSDFDRGQVVGLVKDNIVSTVNVMAFDYGVFGEYNKRITLPGELAIYSMSAINALANAFEKAGVQDPYSRIETTSMVGVNDTKYEVWTLTDQQLFTNFAITKGLGGIGYWSTFYDIEQQLYNANGGALREGHNFGDLWKFKDMLSGTRAKDAYSGGLKTDDLSYATIAKAFTKGTKGIHDYNGEINISEDLWNKINELGIVKVDNVQSITETDIKNLYSIDYVFKDATGFGSDLVTSDNSKDALQGELNWQEWSTNYLDKNLK